MYRQQSWGEKPTNKATFLLQIAFIQHMLVMSLGLLMAIVNVAICTTRAVALSGLATSKVNVGFPQKPSVLGMRGHSKQELTHELSIDASVPRRKRLVDRFLAYHALPHVANVIHLVPVIQVQATHQREIARALRIDFVFARTGAGRPLPMDHRTTACTQTQP